MYFPYLRGRVFELLALRALATNMAEAANATPIIEPVMENPGYLARAAAVLHEARVPHIVIHNSFVGDWRHDHRGQADHVREALEDDDSAIHGFILRADTNLEHLDRFLREYGEERTAIVHWTDFEDQQGLARSLRRATQLRYNVFIDEYTSAPYRATFQRRVVIADEFNPRENNAAYADNPQEAFSDLYLNYRRQGAVGFGDFLTVGARYVQGGGRPAAVAIHLTYERPNPRTIMIRHFVSDERRAPPYNTDDKFFQALAHLVRYINNNRPQFEFSEACDEFRQLHRDHHFPQLGKVKELSLRHHIELMMHVQ
jgi:hypothetical protein